VKVKFSAGAEADILSEPEYRAGVDAIRGSLHKVEDKINGLVPRLDRLDSAVFNADAAGNVGGGATGPGTAVSACPLGQSAKLHRISLTAAGFTPTAPLTQGWIAWYRNAPSATGLVMFLPVGTTAVAPVVIVEGQHDAALLRDGDSLVVVGAGLPANQAFGMAFQIQTLGTTTGERD
jgi:hypothetical protein